MLASAKRGADTSNPTCHIAGHTIVGLDKEMRGDVYSLGMANASAAAAAAAHFVTTVDGLHVHAIAAMTEEDLTMKAVARNPS